MLVTVTNSYIHRGLRLQQHCNALLSADRQAAHANGELREVMRQLASFQGEVARLAAAAAEGDAVKRALEGKETDAAELHCRVAQVCVGFRLGWVGLGEVR